MIQFWSALLLLSYLELCLCKIPPPEHGRFFYLDFHEDGSTGLYHVEFDVLGKTYKLFVTTGESSIGLVSDQCSDEMCQVP